MLISVIIPTRNRASVLVDAVRSILNGNFAQFEIIIVDQSANNITRKVLEESFGDHRVFYIRNERCGASSSRNLGIAHSLGDIVVFTDDDITAPPDWLACIASEFNQHPYLDLLCGSLIAPPYDPQTGFTPEYRADSNVSAWHLPLLVSNANMSFRRRLFDRIGTYDELCGPGSVLRSSDDGDIALRVVRKGGYWKLSPEIEVIHTHGFRPKVEGTALLDEYEYGNGGIYGRALRRGDYIIGGWFVLREALNFLRALRALIRKDRHPLRGWTVRLQGFWHGFRLPPNEGMLTKDMLLQRRAETKLEPIVHVNDTSRVHQ